MAGVEADTRTRLIEVAERLWAERGVNGVSLREIGAAAGQRNTGAARYHFGSKEGLVNAVFEHRMVPVNERREAMLAELEDNDLRGLAEAFLYPLSEQLGQPGRPSWYLRFSMQAAYVDGAAPTDLSAQPWTKGVLELRRRFDAALAELGIPAALRRDRWELFTGHLAGALANRERQVEHLPRKQLSDRTLFLAGLVDTAVALAAAPVSAETARLARRPA
ncbi:MAG: Transcriptional regulator, TetR family [Acidimicrobiales bacterium]|nr:Transcriptional regulator, TetR family [Acidimicrobiales bacterium]